MAKGGAANGRIGGKLSGGVRARNILQAMPRVKIVGAIAKHAGGETWLRLRRGALLDRLGWLQRRQQRQQWEKLLD